MKDLIKSQNCDNHTETKFGCYAVFGWLPGEQLGGSFDFLRSFGTMLEAVKFTNLLGPSWCWHIVELPSLEEVLFANETLDCDIDLDELQVRVEMLN